MSTRKKLFISAILVALTTLGFSHYTLIKTKQDLSKVEKQYHTINQSLEKAEQSLAETKKEKEELNSKVVNLTKKVEEQTTKSKEQKNVISTLSKRIEQNKTNIVTLKKKQISKRIETTQLVSRGSSPSGRSIRMKATGYTAYCNGCSGRTATGINLRANPHLKLIAVDPRVIPLGTRVWVEGYGYAIAGDTGGAINGNKIDVHFATTSQAYAWGVKSVLVKILK